MSLVIFCFLFSSIYYVPVKGEIIWHLSFTIRLISLSIQFTIAKYWKQPKCPSANEWVQKLWYIYTMEFYAAERKKKLIPFATAWMPPPSYPSHLYIFQVRKTLTWRVFQVRWLVLWLNLKYLLGRHNTPSLSKQFFLLAPFFSITARKAFQNSWSSILWSNVVLFWFCSFSISSFLRPILTQLKSTRNFL